MRWMFYNMYHLNGFFFTSSILELNSCQVCQICMKVMLLFVKLRQLQHLSAALNTCLQQIRFVPKGGVSSEEGGKHLAFWSYRKLMLHFHGNI